jgi:uncharacterized iron-regulated membrane protein
MPPLRATLVRRAAFQVHLWAGVLCGLYVLVIGVTGTVLMFRTDLQAWVYPDVFAPAGAGDRVAGVDTVLAAVKGHYSGEVSGFDFPNPRRGTFLAYVVEAGRFRTVYLHPASGRVMGEVPPDGWIQRLQRLHFDLLGGAAGEAASRIGAWALLALGLTGPVIWWPGRRQWYRGFQVAWGAGWKRAIWELHRATGIWVFLLVLMWAATGIHFTTPGLARRIVGTVAPLTTPVPAARAEGGHGERLPLAALVSQAQARWPAAPLARVLLATRPGAAVGITVARDRHGDWDSSDEVTMWFDPASGRLLRTDSASSALSGDVAIRWLGLLHVGNFGGWPVKILWAAGGLALVGLFASGYVMWWNRVVRLGARLRA